MARKCTICSHKSCHEIDTDLVSGKFSIRDIASRYRVGRAALSRHAKGGHIAAKIQQAKNVCDAVAGENLLKRIERRYQRLDQMAARAQRYDEPDVELNVYSREQGYMKIEGMCTGAFREKVEHSGEVNVNTNNPKQMTDAEIIALLRKERDLK